MGMNNNKNKNPNRKNGKSSTATTIMTNANTNGFVEGSMTSVMSSWFTRISSTKTISTLQDLNHPLILVLVVLVMSAMWLTIKLRTIKRAGRELLETKNPMHCTETNEEHVGMEVILKEQDESVQDDNGSIVVLTNTKEHLLHEIQAMEATKAALEQEIDVLEERKRNAVPSSCSTSISTGSDHTSGNAGTIDLSKPSPERRGNRRNNNTDDIGNTDIDNDNDRNGSSPFRWNFSCIPKFL